MAKRKLVLLENHPRIFISKINLAFSYEKINKIDDATKLFAEALSSIDENHQLRTIIEKGLRRCKKNDKKTCVLM